MIAGGHQQHRRRVGPNTVQAEQPGGVAGDERDEQLVETHDLVIKELGTPSQLAQGDACGVAHGVSGAGTQPGGLGHQRRGAGFGETGPHIVRASNHKGSGLVDRLGALVAGAALGHHQRPDRLHHPIASLGRPPGPGPTGRHGRR